jgi:hypothetical protein
MSRIWLSLALAIACLLSACVAFTKQLPTDTPSDAGTAYLFGRFTVTRRSILVPHGADLFGLGLDIDSDNGTEVLLEFLDDKSLIGVVAVPPGTYQIKQMVMSSGGQPHQFAMANPDIKTSFRVEAAKAYYIGDYQGTIRRGAMDRAYLNTIGSNPQTIADFKTRFTELGKLPVLTPLPLSPLVEGKYTDSGSSQ